MSHPSVSVILPTHNSPETLRFAIESVLSQTHKEFELLVVGDGCTDNTQKVVESFDDERVQWLDLPKAPGFGYANRNVALRQARGELIGYLAHDDLWTPDHLELMIAAITERAVEFAYSRVVTVDEQGHLWPTTCNLEGQRILEELTPDELAIGIGAVVHTRGCLERFGYWDETGTPGGDHRLWLGFIRGLGPTGFAFVPTPTNLHFVAEWRKKRQRWWLPTRASLFRRFGVNEELLPPALRVDVPSGMTEQQAIWVSMDNDPAAWTAEMRRAVVAVLDGRLARMDDGTSLILSAASIRLKRWSSTMYRRRYRRQIDDLEQSRETRE